MALLIKISVGAPPENPNDDNAPTVVINNQADIDDLRMTVEDFISSQNDETLDELSDPRKLKYWLIQMAKDAIYRTKKRAAAASVTGADIE